MGSNNCLNEEYTDIYFYYFMKKFVIYLKYIFICSLRDIFSVRKVFACRTAKSNNCKKPGSDFTVNRTSF